MTDDENPMEKNRSSDALGLWREKLAFLRREEVTTEDPAQKFRLKRQIDDAKAKIQELEIEEGPEPRRDGKPEPDGRSSEEGAFFSRLVSDLADIRGLGAEFDHREIKPWTTEVADRFSLISKRLFSESIGPIASKFDLDQDIEDLATQVDQIRKCYPRVLNDGGKLKGRVVEATTKARLLQRRIFEIAPLDPASEDQINAAIIDIYRVIRNLSQKLATEPLSNSRLSSYLETLTDKGGKLVSYYCFLETEENKEPESLRSVGVSLHLIEQGFQLNRSTDWLQNQIDLARDQLEATLRQMGLLDET